MGDASSMIRKILVAVAVSGALLVAVVSGLIATNAAPRGAATSTEAANSGRPYVVKLHAQWCPYCMLTRDVWSQIEATYRDKVNFVVFDFTNHASTDAARAEATRLGLEGFFDEYAGATGLVVVLDGRTKQVAAEIGGWQDFEAYRVAIDAALKRPTE